MMERGQGLTPWTASNNSFGQGKQMRGHSNPNSIIQQKYLGNGTISTCKNRLGKADFPQCTGTFRHVAVHLVSEWNKNHKSEGIEGRD